MTDTAAAPMVYWVIGNGTDVGKTTLATALIRVLNARGVRTVGFKPFGGSMLQGMVDFMLRTYPGAPSKLFGTDAWALTDASPLTDTSLLDVVCPVFMVTHGTWDNVVLMRTGSDTLGDCQYVCNANGAKLKDRADVRELIARTGLPFDTATVAAAVGMRAGTGDAWTKTTRAYGRLLEFGVDAVVVEGNSRWLPLWPECPAIDHLVLVANGLVTLVPGLDIRLEFKSDDPVRDGTELMDLVEQAGRQGMSIPLYLVESARRAAVAQQTVQRLLTEAKLLGN
jgi:hypothetical protein